jgi:hypothetical protein
VPNSQAPATSPLAAPAPTASTPNDHDHPTHHTAPEAPEAEPTEPDNGPPTTRSTIENWMAELRSSRRTGTPDEGRHHSGDGRTVSVNELLRRRDQE